MKPVAKSSLLALFLAGAMSSAFAQDNVSPSPAFAYLGLIPTSVSRPSSPAALGTTVLDSIDASGFVKKGFALDFAPWALLPVGITLQDYQNEPLSFVLANTQLSAAAVKTGGANNDSDIGAGLRVVLVNRRDPEADKEYVQELTKRLRECTPEGDIQPEDMERIAACEDAVFTSYRDEWKKAHWNAGGLAVAVATALHLPGSEIAQSRWHGVGAWIDGSLGIANWGQLSLQARYDYLVVSEDGAYPNVATLSLILGALFGSPDFNLICEYSAEPSWDGVRGWSYTDRLTGSLEFKVSEGVWLSAGLAGSISSADKRLALLSNLRWETVSAPSRANPETLASGSGEE